MLVSSLPHFFETSVCACFASLLQTTRYLPCIHNIAHAVKLEVWLLHLLHPQFSVDRWRLQYRAGGEFSTPSPEELRGDYKMADPPLLAPPQVTFKDLFESLDTGGSGGSGVGSAGSGSGGRGGGGSGGGEDDDNDRSEDADDGGEADEEDDDGSGGGSGGSGGSEDDDNDRGEDDGDGGADDDDRGEYDDGSGGGEDDSCGGEDDDDGGEDDEEGDDGRGGGVADRLRAYGGGSGLGAKPGRKREKRHLAWHELKK